MEFVYYLPDDFNAGTDSWMGLAARQSTNSNMDEHEMGSMSLSISNCKETQFKAANKDNESTMNTDDPNNGVTSWGVTMDHGGVWYHIAVVSDGTNVVTYTNGAKAFRNINRTAMACMPIRPMVASASARRITTTLSTPANTTRTTLTSSCVATCRR